MIFKTQKLSELKNLQNGRQNQIMYAVSNKILNNVWPQNRLSTFHQTIQSIGLKWMNQFVILIQNWLSETSQKYINRLQQLNKLFNKKQSIQIEEQYLMNLSKYILSMQYPLITSINNIQKLYLKYPSDQMIQQPKRPLLCNKQENMSPQNTKKKSLSIESFTSNHFNKSRSKSKGRKLSFFSNSFKQKSNLFETFTKQIKRSSALNTTVKKVKKQIPFNKQSNFATTICHEGFFQGYETKAVNNVDRNNSLYLKQKLEQKMSSTCMSTFFNEIVLDKKQRKQQIFNLNNQIFPNNHQFSEQKQNQEISKTLSPSTNILLQNVGSLETSSILNKNQSYAYLLQDLQSKLNDKFELLMQKIIQNQHTTSKQKDKNDYQINFKQKAKENNQKLQNIVVNNNIIENKCTIQQKKSIQAQQQISKRFSQQKQYEQNKKKEMSKDQIFVKSQIKEQKSAQQKQFFREPSISNFNKQEFKAYQIEEKQKILSKNIQNAEIHYEKIPEITVVQNNKKSRQNKLNSSSIVKKDPSQIIKSKNKNFQVMKQNKAPIIQKKQVDLAKNQVKKAVKHISNQINQINQANSIDSIQIIDESKNKKFITVNKQKSNQKLQQTIAVEKNNTSKNQQAQKNIKQDNFYMKRVKQLKFNMEVCFKKYKQACEKLVLPVNQIFLLIFLNSYQLFCKNNQLNSSSQQIQSFISKYASIEELKSKIPQSQQKFMLDSLGKIDKMVSLKCSPQKKAKIEEYAQKCIVCIENIYFEKPDLKLNSQTEILNKIKQIKSQLTLKSQ